MRKQLLSTLLVFYMMLVLLPVSVFAEEKTIVASGECGAQGDNVTWTLDNEGTLTLSGTGATADYNNYNPPPPWHDVYMDTRNITAIVVEDGITYMGANVLGDGNPSIISIPASVTDLSILNLRSNQLLEFKVDENNQCFCSVDGVLFTKDMSELICYPCAKQDSHYDIPDGVTVIGTSAFARTNDGPQYLSSVTIPNSVEIIGAWAFMECRNLADVTLPTNLRTLGAYAFEYCGLEGAVTIPASVSVIGNSPFIYCTKLSDIVVETDNPYYCSIDGVLFNKNGSRLIEYPIGKTNTTYIVPDSVYWVNEFAFCGSSLVSIDLPDSVTTIGQQGLASNSNLETIQIPENVTYISTSAFSSCTALTSVMIPISLEYIGPGTFGGCSNLKDVYYLGSEKGWQTLMHNSSENTVMWSGTYGVDINQDAVIHFACYDVSFDANGGSGSMENALVEKGSEFTFSNCTFTAPTGKGFKAWSINGVEYAPGDVCTVTADTTVTAVWKDDSTFCTLSGTITGHQGVAYASVTAKLVGLDSTVYSATVTGGESLDGTTKKECTYSVSVPAGQYNLVVEATAVSGTTVNRTALVKLSGDQTKNVNLPNGQAKSNVTVNKSATEVIAGNLDSLIVSDDGSLIAGTSAEVTLTVDDVDTSTTEAVSIQNAASSQTLEFIEFTIRKTVDGTTTAVNDTGNTPIEIVLSFKNAGKRNVKVYRYHDGRVDTLTEQAINGEKIEVTVNSITICAKKFSVYAIGYDSSPENQTPVSGSSSSSNSGSGSFGPSYSITVPNRIIGGKVEVSTDSAKRGDAVTVMTTPDEGYMTVTVAVTDVSGNTLTLTDNDNGMYTFTMPASNVGINVTFAKLDSSGSSVTNPFTDISEGAYYYDAVLWASGNGITNGSSATTFSPDAACTRAQIITFLWRAVGSPAPESESSANPFTDVSTDAYYHDAVLWAVEHGISNGTSATTFSPDVACTRAQAVTFLWRAEETPSVSSGSGFSDVADSAYYANAVKWAVANGVTNGTGSATFSPDADCTRGQIVTFLYRDRVN